MASPPKAPSLFASVRNTFVFRRYQTGCYDNCIADFSNVNKTFVFTLFFSD